MSLSLTCSVKNAAKIVFKVIACLFLTKFKREA